MTIAMSIMYVNGVCREYIFGFARQKIERRKTKNERKTMLSILLRVFIYNIVYLIHMHIKDLTD